jgi:prevent-host-death family protein
MKLTNHWQIQEAKSKLSKVVKSAKSSGPQFVTVHGRETAVILSIDDYNALLKSKGSLIKFFQNSPLFNVELSLERDKEYVRDTDL